MPPPRAPRPARSPLRACPQDAGYRESAGIMVNYEYQMADIDGNHSSYVATGQVAVSERIDRQLRAA